MRRTEQGSGSGGEQGWKTAPLLLLPHTPALCERHAVVDQADLKTCRMAIKAGLYQWPTGRVRSISPRDLAIMTRRAQRTLSAGQVLFVTTPQNEIVGTITDVAWSEHDGCAVVSMEILPGYGDLAASLVWEDRLPKTDCVLRN